MENLKNTKPFKYILILLAIILVTGFLYRSLYLSNDYRHKIYYKYNSKKKNSLSYYLGLIPQEYYYCFDEKVVYTNKDLQIRTVYDAYFPLISNFKIVRIKEENLFLKTPIELEINKKTDAKNKPIKLSVFNKVTKLLKINDKQKVIDFYIKLLPVYDNAEYYEVISNQEKFIKHKKLWENDFKDIFLSRLKKNGFINEKSEFTVPVNKKFLYLKGIGYLILEFQFKNNTLNNVYIYNLGEGKKVFIEL